MRYEYAALVSMCDHHLGRVLDLMDPLELWEDTMLILCTDHGFLLGEHDWWAKIIMPWYNEIIHTPSLHLGPSPRGRGEQRGRLVQTIDIMPTMLDFFGIELPGNIDGAALTTSLQRKCSVHEAALFGVHGGHVNVTDGRYVYMRAPVNRLTLRFLNTP